MNLYKDLDRRKWLRSALLLRTYECSQSDPLCPVDLAALREFMQVQEQEISTLLQFLVAEHVVSHDARTGSVRITHGGVLFIEELLDDPYHAPASYAPLIDLGLEVKEPAPPPEAGSCTRRSKSSER